MFPYSDVAQPWLILLIVVMLSLSTALFIRTRVKSAINTSSQVEIERESSGRWATLKDLKRQGMVGDFKHPDPRRLALGEMDGREIVNGIQRSVMVLAPTGAGKTPRFVVPRVLCHDGPALVASVKSDVLALTQDWREKQGPVWVFDPLESRGKTARWSPLAMIHTWADALDAATWLQEASAAEGKGIEAQAFWDAQSRRLLAPLLLLAAHTGCTMNDVFEMVADARSREQELGARITELSLEAGSYWSLFTGLADKTKSSVLATAADVLEAWSHPMMQRAVDVQAGDPSVLDIGELLDSKGTLYLVAPVSVQAQFTAVYETLVNAVLMEIQRRYHATSLPLPNPFLLMLDEAANIAPLRRLDMVATAMAGMGCITVSVWQSEGQIQKNYGPDKARVIIANHTASIYLPGIADRQTLESLSKTIGEDLVERATDSKDGHGGHSYSSRLETITVAPPETLREMPPDEAIVITGNAKPMKLELVGWFEDKELRSRVNPEVARAMDDQFGARKSPRKLLAGFRGAA